MIWQKEKNVCRRDMAERITQNAKRNGRKDEAEQRIKRYGRKDNTNKDKWQKG